VEKRVVIGFRKNVFLDTIKFIFSLKTAVMKYDPSAGSKLGIQRLKPLWKKLLATTVIVLTYSLLNYFVRIDLPGISNVDIRPQIVLIFVAGYFLGPVLGFIAGFAGNLITDFLFGYGLTYLFSWTIGNGLIGALIGLLPYRKQHQIDRIGQLGLLVIAIIMISIVSLAYAAGMESISGSKLTSNINFRFFYLPALLSNLLGTLIMFPVILLSMGRLKKNFPIKIALSNYYLTIFLVISTWVIFALYFQSLPEKLIAAEPDIIKGNALVIIFNRWAMLLVGMLIISFFISGWLSNMVVGPLKHLEETVYAVLKGDPASADRLDHSSKRQDEIGILSYTVKLLSEKLWETQLLFRDEMNKKMKFLDKGDTGTDVFIIALVSLFGKDVLENREAEQYFTNTGEISNISAISLLVSAGGLRELAATYSDAKIKKSIEGLDQSILKLIKTKEEKQALALAVDLKLVFRGRLKVLDVMAFLDPDFAFHLLERIQAFRKNDNNYIGYVTQHDIVSRLQDKWEKSEAISSEILESIMKKAVAHQVIKGYLIKNRADITQFDEGLKIMYSHSNFKHIKQLIGLLVSENLQAKIQLEPKRSSFRYLDEWEKTPDLNLERIEGGFFIAHKNEFDLVMEFASAEQRDRFREIIEAFAKRETESSENLLFDSWYQPLYCSEVAVDGYYIIAKLVISDEKHVIHTYCTQQNAETIIAWLKNEEEGLDVSASVFWVNDAFLRYLEGTTSV
jgi:uncharacterized membrane protein